MFSLKVKNWHCHCNINRELGIIISSISHFNCPSLCCCIWIGWVDWMTMPSLQWPFELQQAFSLSLLSTLVAITGWGPNSRGCREVTSTTRWTLTGWIWCLPLIGRSFSCHWEAAWTRHNILRRRACLTCQRPSRQQTCLSTRPWRWRRSNRRWCRRLGGMKWRMSRPPLQRTSMPMPRRSLNCSTPASSASSNVPSVWNRSCPRSTSAGADTWYDADTVHYHLSFHSERD